jgi:uncharacterized membrane protein YvbJ
MVYCTKCGTKNEDGSNVCIDCGSPLLNKNDIKGSVRYGQYEEEIGFHLKIKPNTWIFVGLLILLAGFIVLAAEIYRISIPWVPIIFILAGIFVLARFFQMRRQGQ